MSCIKRWLDEEVEILSNQYGYLWDSLMEKLCDMDFDLDELRKQLASGELTM